MSDPRAAIVFLFLSWCTGIYGLTLGLQVTPELFSRMGSIIVLLAVASEYTLLKCELTRLYGKLQGCGGSQDGGMGITKLVPSFWHRTQANLSHITIIIGTLIWGFGDLWL
jgi:hypothetical protein